MRNLIIEERRVECVTEIRRSEKAAEREEALFRGKHREEGCG